MRAGRLAGGRGPGCRREGRRNPLQRPARRPAGRGRLANAPATCSTRRRCPARPPRPPTGWLKLAGVTRNNLDDLDVEFPLGVFTTVTGVSGSGKSSLVSQVLVELVAEHLGQDVSDRGRRSGRPRPARARHPRRAHHRRHGRHQAPGARRPEAHRPHAALQHGHLHGLVRPRAQAVCRHARGPQAPLRRRPLLLQRGQGPLRKLPGRRLRDGGAAVSAQRVRALPRVPRRPLQRQNPGNRIPRTRTSPRCWA